MRKLLFPRFFFPSFSLGIKVTTWEHNHTWSIRTEKNTSDAKFFFHRVAAPFPFPLAPLNFPLASPFQFSSQGGFCQPSASVLKGSWIVRPAAGKSTVKVDGLPTFSVCLQGTVSNLSWLERVGTKMHLAKINFDGFLFSYEGRTIQERSSWSQFSSVRSAFSRESN